MIVTCVAGLLVQPWFSRRCSATTTDLLATVMLALPRRGKTRFHSITRHVASTGIRERSSNRPSPYLLRRPLWLAGWAAAAGAFGFQAAALHYGPLSIVQPLLVAELVFASFCAGCGYARTCRARAGRRRWSCACRWQCS